MQQNGHFLLIFFLVLQNSTFTFSIIITMQNQPFQDLRQTPNFHEQKPMTFGSADRGFLSGVKVNKTHKNSSIFDNFFNNNLPNIFQDNLQAAQKEIEQQETKKRIIIFENAQDCNKSDQKVINGAKQFGNFNHDKSSMTFEEQLNNIIPSVLRESLQETSSIGKIQTKAQKKQVNFQNIENGNESSDSSNVEINLNLISCNYLTQEVAKQQRNALNKLSLNKQVAITYVPYKYTKYGAHKTGQYEKFGSKNIEKEDLLSSKSLYSNKLQQNNQLKDCMVSSTSNFIKLHEVDLFMRKKQIRIQRSDQLLQANEKLLTGHLIAKQELEKTKKTLERLSLQYKSKIQQLQHELKLQRQRKMQTLAQKELRQANIKSIKMLNEQYLKENNALKEKIKEYVKIIHELKYYSSNKPTINQQINTQIQLKNKIYNIKTIIPPLATINSLPSNFQITDRSHEPAQYKKQAKFHQQPEYMPTVNYQQKTSSTKNHNNQRKYSINDVSAQNYMTKGCKNTNSQKSIIIKRNVPSQDSEGINKAFIKLNKNVVNDGSLIMKLAEDQHNKSISSYSNVSGMSLTHKIGHIPKAHQSKKGVLLDYMTTQETNELQKQNKCKPSHRNQGP